MENIHTEKDTGDTACVCRDIFHILFQLISQYNQSFHKQCRCQKCHSKPYGIQHHQLPFTAYRENIQLYLCGIGKKHLLLVVIIVKHHLICCFHVYRSLDFQIRRICNFYGSCSLGCRPDTYHGSAASEDI